MSSIVQEAVKFNAKTNKTFFILIIFFIIYFRFFDIIFNISTDKVKNKEKYK